MKKLLTAAAALMLCSHPAQAEDMKPLYDCARGLHEAGAAPPAGHDVEFLDDGLFYILDSRAPELYLFTPYFAGNADLPHNLKAEVKRTLDAHPVSANPFPFTPCCQGGFTYGVRIPYAPGNPSKPNGYFYMTLNDSTPVMYDEVYWDRQEKKMHAVRHATPFIKPNPSDTGILGLVRFLAGPAQAMPDFTNYKPKQAVNGVTITYVSGQIDKGLAYYPLDVEAQLWSKTARGNFSAAAKEVLLSDIQYSLHKLPPEHTVGQRAECWGHAGCDYTYSKEEVEREHAIHTGVIRACTAALSASGIK